MSVTERSRYAPELVLLNQRWIELAKTAGEGRYTRRREAGSEHRWNRGDDHTVELEIEAVGAEIAVGCSIGRRWEDVETPDYSGDVGEGVQVRHTQHGRYLLLHGPESVASGEREDRDDHDFFLVTGMFPEYIVVGWATGARGKRIGEVKELQRGRPCICVDGVLLAAPAQWRRFSRWAP